MNNGWKGRFAKEEKGKIILNLPFLKIYYFILCYSFIFMVYYYLRLNLLQAIIAKFEEIFSFPHKNEES